MNRGSDKQVKDSAVFTFDKAGTYRVSAENNWKKIRIKRLYEEAFKEAAISKVVFKPTKSSITKKQRDYLFKHGWRSYEGPIT